MSDEERYHFLRNVPIFRSWGYFELYRLAHCMTFKTYPKGYTLIQKEHVSPSLCFISSGRVDVIRYNDMRGSLSSIKEYGYFGESGILNVFLQSRRNDVRERHDIIALTPVKALVLEPRDYHLLWHSE